MSQLGDGERAVLTVLLRKFAMARESGAAQATLKLDGYERDLLQRILGEDAGTSVAVDSLLRKLEDADVTRGMEDQFPEG